MKLLFYCLIFFTAVHAKAQSSGLEFFTEDGENFTLMINGVRKNATPATNVKAPDLSGDGVKVKIVFEKAIPAFDKFVMLTPGENIVFAIRKNNKGEYALRMVSTGSVAASPAASEPRGPSSNSTSQNTQVAQSNSSVSTTSTTTQTMEGGNVSISMNVNGTAMGASGVITESQPGISMTMTVGSPAPAATSTTVTSSYATSSSATEVDSQNSQNQTSAGSPCSMSTSDYNEVVNSVKSKSFADVKLTVLKQAIKNQCVAASQVKSLAGLLSFEEDKLDFAKFAYDYTSDKKNYYRVNDAFAYESTIDELNRFLESKR